MRGPETVQSTDALTQALYQAISALWIVDAHEHLPPEADRLAMTVDAVALFENYPMWDLKAAGLSDAECSTIVDREVPLDQRWQVFHRYLPLIRNTSFTRTALLGLRELYGFADLTADNYRQVSAAMQAANQPGIYRRAFHDRGRIVAALNQVYPRIWQGLPAPGSFRIPQLFEAQFSVALGARALRFIEVELGRTISSFAAYVEAVTELLGQFRRRGVVGIKLDKTVVQSCSPDTDVAPLFDRVRQACDDMPATALPVAAEVTCKHRGGKWQL